MRGLVLLLVAVSIGWWCGVAWADRWVRPVDGRVVGRFEVHGSPFAAGQRRGVDLAAAPGARVVAPCGGSVAFAGAVPGRGLGVSVRCGPLTATVLGLARLDVRGGDAVRRGAPVGTAGGRIRLGARVTAERFGYRDPLALIGASERRVWPPSVGPRVRPRPTPPPAAVAPRFRPRGAPSPGGAPALAWIGVALVACALPGGAIAWRARRSRLPLARRLGSRAR